MMRRRDALKTIGGLGAAASMARLLPACGDSDDGPTGITTYVYLMMENRSYDHLFGARSMLEGKPGDGLRPSMTQLDRSGVAIAPWAPRRDQLCDLDPPHGWTRSRAAFNGGLNDGFLVQHQLDHNSMTAIEPMQYLTRTELPVSWALADQYAIADRWFCSVMGPTWPNRYYWLTGTSGGKMDNLPVPGVSLPWPSIFNRLRDKGIDWASFYGNVSTATLWSNFDVRDHVHPFMEFLDVAKAGKLPPVVYIDPAFGANDDHPPSHPINGQELIAAVYTALAASPQWKNCLLVVTYDEHGGFFDHVPPPTTVDDQAALGFNQMGFRVPTLVAGPYVKEGYVSNVVYDHCSALRELELAFDFEPLNQRTAAAKDLSDFIDMDRLAKGDWRKPITLPTVDVSQWPMGPECVGSALRPASHPVIEWADANPELVAGYDIRPRSEEYRRVIREFLATHTGRLVR
jgi:phospholipase C